MKLFAGASKKALFIFIICAFLFPSITSASALSDAKKKIETLTSQIQLLKNRLGAAAIGSTTLLAPTTKTTTTSITKTAVALDETPTVTLISPNGGETFTEGQQITVRWSTANLPAGTIIGFDLFSSDNATQGLTMFNPAGIAEFENDGQETLVIPRVQGYANWRYGNYYKLTLITSDPDITIKDSSNGTFSINGAAVTPSITLVSPNGGETYTAGQQITVRWNTSNIPSSAAIGVILEAPFSGGTSYALNPYLVGGGEVLNTGSATFILPKQGLGNGLWYQMQYGNYYKIKIEQTTSTTGVFASDTSNNTFTIQAPATPVSLDTTKRIAYWQGKVNQHTDANGNWVSDPDGTSGAELDKVTYCKKWYPQTVSVQAYQMETITTWKRARDFEQSNYTNTVPTYKCVQGAVGTPAITVLSPNGGEVYQAGQQITVRWTSSNIPNNRVDVYLFGERPDNTTAGGNFGGSTFTASDGQGIITLPTRSDLPFGNNFKVFIVPAGFNDDAPVIDWSDNMFTIQVAHTAPTCAIDSFTANPTTIPAGGSSTLSWEVTNGCNSVVINHGNATTNQLSTEGSISTNTVGGTSTPNTYILLASSTPGCFGAPYSTTTGGTCSYINQGVTIQIGNPLTCSSTAPSIKVLSPNGGETYQAGHPLTITWETCNIPTNPYAMSINLWHKTTYQGGGPVPAGTVMYVPTGVYASVPSNSGTHTLLLPVSLASINDYIVRVDGSLTGQEGSGFADDSDQTFTVSSSNLIPPGCNSTAGYSTTTGQPCNLPEGCLVGVLFSTVTGLPCTQINRPAPGATASLAKTSFTRELKVGSSGADVMALQNRLKTEGVFTGNSTGYFGTMTEAAVKKFQTKYGIPPVGSIGPRTLQVLNK